MPLVKSINQDDLRNHNLSVVLSAMARSREPMSRACFHYLGSFFIPHQS